MKKAYIRGKVLIMMVLSLVFMATTCTKEDENHHKTLLFVNNSDKSVYVMGSAEYPDTANVQGMGGGGLSDPNVYKVQPNSSNENALYWGAVWEEIFQDAISIPSDTLMVYVFDAKLLESQTMHVQNTIIQRYDLSLRDLQHLNWKLTYPPSSNMSGMKMYPPYGK